MNKELEELKEQLDVWISRTKPDLYDNEQEEYWKEMGSLASLLIVRDWVKDKLKQ